MTAAYGSDHSLGAFVSQMTVDYQKGMKHPRYPEQQSQQDVQNTLNGLAAKQNGQGWKDNGKKIPHIGALSTLPGGHARDSVAKPVPNQATRCPFGPSRITTTFTGQPTLIDHQGRTVLAIPYLSIVPLPARAGNCLVDAITRFEMRLEDSVSWAEDAASMATVRRW